MVGRISQEPPDLHVEVVVDETRFSVEPSLVMEGYERRAEDVPEAWMDAVTVVNPYADAYDDQSDDRWSGSRGSQLSDDLR